MTVKPLLGQRPLTTPRSHKAGQSETGARDREQRGGDEEVDAEVILQVQSGAGAARPGDEEGVGGEGEEELVRGSRLAFGYSCGDGKAGGRQEEKSGGGRGKGKESTYKAQHHPLGPIPLAAHIIPRPLAREPARAVDAYSGDEEYAGEEEHEEGAGAEEDRAGIEHRGYAVACFGGDSIHPLDLKIYSYK